MLSWKIKSNFYLENKNFLQCHPLLNAGIKRPSRIAVLMILDYTGT
jgi:hypothetical protein